MNNDNRSSQNPIANGALFIVCPHGVTAVNCEVCQSLRSIISSPDKFSRPERRRAQRIMTKLEEIFSSKFKYKR